MRRVGAAYIADPRLVLLDEVSMGLAPLVVDEIFEFIGRLTAAGTAQLLVEQYVRRALDVADLRVPAQPGSGQLRWRPR